MAASGGKNWGTCIWSFQLFWTYFLAESVLLDGFRAKEFIFRGFVEFQFFVFAKRRILLKNGCGGAFQFYVQILT